MKAQNRGCRGASGDYDLDVKWGFTFHTSESHDGKDTIVPIIIPVGCVFVNYGTSKPRFVFIELLFHILELMLKVFVRYWERAVVEVGFS